MQCQSTLRGALDKENSPIGKPYLYCIPKISRYIELTPG